MSNFYFRFDYNYKINDLPMKKKTIEFNSDYFECCFYSEKRLNKFSFVGDEQNVVQFVWVRTAG